MGTDFTVFNPAFPTNKRTVYKGYLFVGDELLSESGMRHHPLTPMTDPSLVRVLQRQTRHKVGLVQYATVVKGAQAVREAFAALRRDGVRYVILDSITDEHLITLGEACAELKLVTGGSGMAMGLPANFVRQGLLERGQRHPLPKVTGPTVVLAGSCSVATQGQVAHMKRDHEAFELDPMAIASGQGCRRRGAGMGGDAAGREADSDLLHGRARAGQGRAGQARARACGRMIEDTLGKIAQGLVAAACAGWWWPAARPPGRWSVRSASRACTSAPRSTPACRGPSASARPTLALALKSGNFGTPDFFTKAFGAQP